MPITHREQHRNDRIGWLRAAVLGALAEWGRVWRVQFVPVKPNYFDPVSIPRLGLRTVSTTDACVKPDAAEFTSAEFHLPPNATAGNPTLPPRPRVRRRGRVKYRLKFVEHRLFQQAPPGGGEGYFALVFLVGW